MIDKFKKYKKKEAVIALYCLLGAHNSKWQIKRYRHYFWLQRGEEIIDIFGQRPNVPGTKYKFELISDENYVCGVKPLDSGVLDIIIQNEPNPFIYLDNLDDELSRCSFHGQLKNVMLLVDLGADIHYYHDAAIRVAMCSGHVPVVAYLASIGGDVTSSDYHGFIQACYYENRDMVSHLILQENILGDKQNFQDIPGIEGITRQVSDSFLSFMTQTLNVYKDKKLLSTLDSGKKTISHKL